MSDMVGGCLVYSTGPDDNTTGGPADRETVEEMDKELTKVIEDFGRAVDVETLRLSKETGKPLLSQPRDILFSVVSYRAAVFAWTARTCQGGPRLGSPPYGTHPPNYSFSDHDGGGRPPGKG